MTEPTESTGSLRMWQLSQLSAEKAIEVSRRKIATQQAELKTQEEGLALINRSISRIMAKNGGKV